MKDYAIHKGIFLFYFILIILYASVNGCTQKDLKANQERIRKDHAPRIQIMLQEDFESHRRGIGKAAAWLAPFYQQALQGEEREQQIRFQLQKIQKPSKGVTELVVSPLSFLAAIDSQGYVIARDSEIDLMKGKNFAERFDVVQKVLNEGGTESALGYFDEKESDVTSISLLFVSEIRKEEKRLGVVMAGIPFWRLAQKMSRQLRAEHAQKINEGMVLWVYLFKKDKFFHFGTPPEIFSAIEKAELQNQIQSLPPEGKVGSLNVHGRTYAWGAFKLIQLGKDVAVLIVRASPV